MQKKGLQKSKEYMHALGPQGVAASRASGLTMVDARIPQEINDVELRFRGWGSEFQSCTPDREPQARPPRGSAACQLQSQPEERCPGLRAWRALKKCHPANLSRHLEILILPHAKVVKTDEKQAAGTSNKSNYTCEPQVCCRCCVTMYTELPQLLLG